MHNYEIDRIIESNNDLRLENHKLKLENDMLRKMRVDIEQLNKLLIEDRKEMQACAGLPSRKEWEESGFTVPDELCKKPGLPELKPITTTLAPAPAPMVFPKGRWDTL